MVKTTDVCVYVYVEVVEMVCGCTSVYVCMYCARIGTESGHGKGIGALRPRLDSAGRGRLVGG